ncbi:hypothetical protein HLB27_19675 [Dickeya dadantii]|uniref:hypothetical protein n=1 Tax=Dickeya dadantii TaxID=204038 RepID=UPI0014958219|nr:hypothetical protein [Dickeya dadantii]NPE58669.1 hypothetical protein [Dickeya dadantii]NPE72560.1 hypothetical protein [Dickeya dadantii]
MSDFNFFRRLDELLEAYEERLADDPRECGLLSSAVKAELLRQKLHGLRSAFRDSFPHDDQGVVIAMSESDAVEKMMIDTQIELVTHMCKIRRALEMENVL